MNAQRYPGLRPFTQEDRLVFCGRENDLERLNALLELNPLLVLYGKSGMGKSSLIEAGLLPDLRKSYPVISVRFNQFDDAVSPLDLLNQRLDDQTDDEIFQANIRKENISLWQKCKQIQKANPQSKGILFVFDQFEELFMHKEGVEAFTAAISELLSDKMDAGFREDLENAMMDNPEVLSDEEWNFIDKPLNVKILFSIRSDKMALLNRMSRQIPEVLLNCYELKAFDIMQARMAINLPAMTEGSFDSPAFRFAPAAIHTLIDYLSKDRSDTIEPFQLQILCENIEHKLINGEIRTTLEDGQPLVLKEDLGDLTAISQNYYESQIEKAGDKEDQLKARILLEEALILPDEKQRLSLDIGQIKHNYQINESLLNKLIDARLLRSEPNSRGGVSYEISHDTLVGPILLSRDRRLKEDYEVAQRKQLQEELEKKQRIQQEKFNRQRRVWGISALIAFSVISLIFSILLWRQNAKITAINTQIVEINGEIQQAYNTLQKYVKIKTDENGDTIGVVILIENAFTVIDEFNRKIQIYDELVKKLQAGLKTGTAKTELLEEIERTQLELEILEEEFLKPIMPADATVLMDQAQLLYDEGKYLAAWDKYQQVLDIAPKDSLAEKGKNDTEWEITEDRIALLLKKTAEYIGLQSWDLANQANERVLSLQNDHQIAIQNRQIIANQRIGPDSKDDILDRLVISPLRSEAFDVFDQENWEIASRYLAQLTRLNNTDNEARDRLVISKARMGGLEADSNLDPVLLALGRGACDEALSLFKLLDDKSSVPADVQRRIADCEEKMLLAQQQAEQNENEDEEVSEELVSETDEIQPDIDSESLVSTEEVDEEKSDSLSDEESIARSLLMGLSLEDVLKLASGKQKLA